MRSSAVGNVESPGPRFTAGTPAAAVAGHVGPAELGPDLEVVAARRAPRGAGGRGRAGAVGDSIRSKRSPSSSTGRRLADDASLVGVRSGAKRWFKTTVARSAPRCGPRHPRRAAWRAFAVLAAGEHRPALRAGVDQGQERCQGGCTALQPIHGRALCERWPTSSISMHRPPAARLDRRRWAHRARRHRRRAGRDGWRRARRGRCRPRRSRGRRRRG